MTEKLLVSIIVVGITQGIIENKTGSFQDLNAEYSFKKDEIQNEIKYFIEKNLNDEISTDGSSAIFRQVAATGDLGDFKDLKSYILIAEPVVKIIPDNSKSSKDYKIYKKPFIKNNKDYLFKDPVNNIKELNLRNTNCVKRSFKKNNKPYFT